MYNMLIVDNLIIDWTPKAGSLCVCRMVFESMGLLEEALQYHPWLHEYRADVFYRRYGRVNNKILSKNEHVRIKFVRNPYHRAVSSYTHLPLVLEDLGVEENPYESFSDFLKAVKGGELADSHWRCQYQSFEHTYGFDEIIKVENIYDEVERLNKKYKLNWKYVSGSDHHRNSSYEDFYDEETQALVEEIYADDFEAYGYQRKGILRK